MEVAEVNLWGTVRTTKAFLPLIRRSKGEWFPPDFHSVEWVLCPAPCLTVTETRRFTTLLSAPLATFLPLQTECDPQHRHNGSGAHMSLSIKMQNSSCSGANYLTKWGYFLLYVAQGAFLCREKVSASVVEVALSHITHHRALIESAEKGRLWLDCSIQSPTSALPCHNERGGKMQLCAWSHNPAVTQRRMQWT